MRSYELLVLLSLPLVGCATMFTDDHVEIHVESPATVFFVDNVPVKGTWTKVNQRTSHELSVNIKGCTDEKTMKTTIARAYGANLLWGIAGVAAGAPLKKPWIFAVGLGVTINWLVWDWVLGNHKVAEKTHFEFC